MKTTTSNTPRTNLDRLAAKVSHADMQQFAKLANDQLCGIINEDPSTISARVRDLTEAGSHDLIDCSSQQEMTVAVAAAAVLMASKDESLNDSEKLEAALVILSDLYQADW